MNFSKYFLFFFVLYLDSYVHTTINLTLTIPTCNQNQMCGTDSKCASSCDFGSLGLNAAGNIVTIQIDKNAIINNIGNIKSNTQTTVLFEKKSKQIIVAYTPTVGRLQNKSISLLFQLIDLRDTSYIAKLPKTMQTDIATYTTNKSSIGYVLFLFKGLRKNIWTEISQTYIDHSSKDQTGIPLILQPDGNIHITTPGISNKQKEEDFYIKIEQIS